MPATWNKSALLLLLSLGLNLLGQASVQAEEAPKIDFSRQVLPILSDQCFLCHGPDEGSREADLRLDRQEDALRTESPLIVPGKSADSELIRRILSTDPDEVMPPPATKRMLTAEQKQILQQWIDQGAKWGKHWAFESVVRPAVPNVAENNWVRNPLDAFILTRLEKEKLAPSPEAEKATLLRRVTLDLTGLPPTPAELSAFLADESPTAYETVVDRLLQSPRSGERMVWEWLDAARYADTNGYQGDPTRSMYFWRDWAIEAFNQNMPFDQFTIEQLAGDLLPQPTQSQLIATGFHRNHMINGEGGRIAEESRIDYVQDRVETTGTVWLGLSFNCCRCHTHKYDPILHREYYQLAAYFNSIDETGGNDAGGLANPVLSLANEEQQSQLAALKQAEQLASQTRKQREEQLANEFTQWLAQRSNPGESAASPWITLVPQSATSAAAVELKLQEDHSVLATGKNPDTDKYTIVWRAPRGGIVGFRLEALPDASFINQGPGRADNGNFVLNEIQIRVKDQPLKLVSRGADFSQTGWPADGALDGKPASGWAVMPEFGKPHQLTFVPEQPVGTAEEELELTCDLHFNFGRQHTLGKFRLLATTDAAAVSDALPAEVRAILAKADEQRNDADKKRLREFHRDQDATYLSAVKSVEKAREEREKFEKSLPKTMVMRERGEPRKTFVLTRGLYNKPEEEVQPGVPAVLPPLPAGSANNRLALAEWLVSKEQPLMPRVVVNRLWQQVFGIGLVKTAEDFGVQGEKPVHPELLDWLASEFRDPILEQPASVATSSGAKAWNVKHLLRLMVTSATYRQSSRATPELLEKDPENRLLARAPRYRLPSWMIRDQALAASGLLVEKLGGPPVKGYQPAGVWEEATFGNIKYVQDHGEALYRRSVYQFWRRIVGPTVFFDVARRQTCEVKSSRTNTPLQALVTLNDITYLEAARVLAQQALLESPTGSPPERIARMFRRVLIREPSEAELQVLASSVEKLQAQFAENVSGAEKLLDYGESPRDKSLPPADHAAYAAVASILLNLDETLSRE